MKTLTSSWRTIKYSFWIICLLTLIYFAIANYRFPSLPKNIYSLSGHTTPRAPSMPGIPQPHISESSDQAQAIDNVLFKNSTCSSNESHFSWLPCSSCLRSGVHNLQLLDVTQKDNLIYDQYKDYFKTAPDVIERLVTDYVIAPALDCPYVLALQPSVKDRVHERDLVRKTWGSIAVNQTWPNRSINAKLKILFVVGNLESKGQDKKENRSRQVAEILSEARLHNDILYINMNDNYYNLTLKLLSAFKWVKDNCPCVKFVLKVDFDTFVNVPLLVDTLLHFENRLNFSILGMTYGSYATARRTGRWAVPTSLYPLKTYPAYASGCGYVLSIKVISTILDTVPHLRSLAIEDVFITGIVRRVIGCQLFTLSSAFTHYHDRKWHYCDIFNDKKILGMSNNGNKHQRIWQSFYGNSCK